ncbi:hypothetical protein CNMCM5793_005090 [Aspergillus hiratsukae]|uniref:Endonuclease/exonuclease/phosphatase domain-containing protein n=1 Tax=Aspergillus hiratsukae TaxID=1194566 RepID=A0A8H6UZC1_9EURO|nr:hypothetical protein CNMCM5793_005090 [Aspergillus hiratsukae]KAF7172813.1 hypothetical protein CNMCM6106_006932 [Aspergillus hiratsukae]
MLGNPMRHRDNGRNRQRNTLDLQVCWVNVGRSAPCHTIALQLAFERRCDVVCIQEPFTFPRTKTSNHPSYECFAPVDAWDSEEHRERESPRVMTVHDYKILNIYRQPTTPEVIDYGVMNTHQGAELAEWASASGMNFIGERGVPTRRHGHVIDLTFSNVPFARTELAGLLGNQLAALPDPWELNTTDQLDDYATQLATALNEAVKIAAKPDRGQGAAPPWWTPDCKTAHQDWLHAKFDPRLDPEERKTAREEFQATVRNAKQGYWKRIIDDVKDDKDLYKIMAWHKLTPKLKAPPLLVDGRPIRTPLEKAEALRASVPGHFNEEDGLPEDPLENWAGTGHLPWTTSVTLEHHQRHQHLARDRPHHRSTTQGLLGTPPGPPARSLQPLPRPLPLPTPLAAGGGGHAAKSR